MTRQIIGLALIASPFVALFIYVTARDGILTALGVFALTAAVVAVIGLGVWMTT